MRLFFLWNMKPYQSWFKSFIWNITSFQWILRLKFLIWETEYFVSHNNSSLIFHNIQISFKNTRDQFKACCESNIKHVLYACWVFTSSDISHCYQKRKEIEEGNFRNSLFMTKHVLCFQKFLWVLHVGIKW